MTVPPLFGWEVIAVALLLFAALAVTFFVLSAVGRNTSERRELQAWLDARSLRSGEPGPGPDAGGTTVDDGGAVEERASASRYERTRQAE